MKINIAVVVLVKVTSKVPFGVTHRNPNCHRRGDEANIQHNLNNRAATGWFALSRLSDETPSRH